MTALPRRWVNGASLKERLQVYTCSITLNDEPISTASLKLPPDTSLEVLNFVELFTPYESAGIFRVAQIEKDIVTGNSTADLERGECTLGDIQVPDGVNAVAGELSSAISTVLGYQPQDQVYWTAGTVPSGITVYVDIAGQTLLDCLNSMSKQLSSHRIVYDQSTYPWVVKVEAISSTASCEGRLSRNLSSCSVRYDMSELCTRAVSKELTNGYLDNSAKIQLYGIIEKDVSINSSLTAAQKIAVAQNFLNNHDAPDISVEISGRELYTVTGLAIDKFKLGTVFRLALPNYGLTILQRIVSVKYGDVYNKPEDINISLANKRADLAFGIMKSVKKSGAKSKKQMETDKALFYQWISDDRTRIGTLEANSTSFMTVYQALTSNNLINKMSALVQNAEGFDFSASYITAADEMSDAQIQAAIQELETRLNGLYLPADDPDYVAIKALYAGINVNATGINSVVQAFTDSSGNLEISNLSDKIAALSTLVSQTAGSWSVNVLQNGSDVITAILADNSGVTITAAHVDVSGILSAAGIAIKDGLIKKVSAKEVDATGSVSGAIGDFGTLTLSEGIMINGTAVPVTSLATQSWIQSQGYLTAPNDKLIITELQAGKISATTSLQAGSSTFGTVTVTSGLTVNGVPMGDAVASFGTVSTSNAGVVSIPYTMLGGGTGTITFNQADTAFLKSAVSAAYGTAINNASISYTYLSGTHNYGATISYTDPNGVTHNHTFEDKTGQEVWNSVGVNDIWIYSTVGYASSSTGGTYTIPLAAIADNGAVYVENVPMSGESAYKAGAAAVAISGPSWSTSLPNSQTNSNTATYATGWPNRSVSTTLLLTNASNGWKNGKYPVFGTVGDSLETHAFAKLEVSMPSSGTWGGTKTSYNNFHVTFQAGGKTYEHDFTI